MSSALTLLGDAISREVLESLRGTCLRHGHGYLMQRLLLGPCTATEIARELGVTQQAVSKGIKELIQLGHVEFVPDTADRRRRPVTLTADGRKAVETARATRRSLDRRLRNALGSPDFDRTMHALRLALEALGIADRVDRRAVQPPDESAFVTNG